MPGSEDDPTAADAAATGPVIDCVGAIVHNPAGRLLLVRRANPPGQGLWSLPGGKVEPGEDDAAAVVREVAEETGLQVTAGRLVAVVELPTPGGGTFRIVDLVCHPVGGTVTAGTDASDAAWFDAEALAAVQTTPGLTALLEQWGLLPRSPTSGR